MLRIAEDIGAPDANVWAAKVLAVAGQHGLPPVLVARALALVTPSSTGPNLSEVRQLVLDFNTAKEPSPLRKDLEGTPYTEADVRQATQRDLGKDELLLLARNDALNISGRSDLRDLLESDGRGYDGLMAAYKHHQPAFFNQVEAMGLSDPLTNLIVNAMGWRPVTVSLQEAFYLAQHRSLLTQPVENTNLRELHRVLNETLIEGPPRVGEIDAYSWDGRSVRLVAYLDEQGQFQLAAKYRMERDAPFQGASPFPKKNGALEGFHYTNRFPVDQLIYSMRYQLFDATPAEQAVRHASNFTQLADAVNLHEDGAQATRARAWAVTQQGEPVNFYLRFRNGQLQTFPPLSVQTIAALSNIRYELSEVPALPVEPPARTPVKEGAQDFASNLDAGAVRLGTTYSLEGKRRTDRFGRSSTAASLSLSDIEEKAKSVFINSGMRDSGKVLRVNVLGSPGLNASSDHFQLELSTHPLPKLPGLRTVVDYLDRDGRRLSEQNGQPLIRTADFAQGIPLNQRAYAQMSFDFHEVIDGVPQASLHNDPQLNDVSLREPASGDDVVARAQTETKTSLSHALTNLNSASSTEVSSLASDLDGVGSLPQPNRAYALSVGDEHQDRTFETAAGQLAQAFSRMRTSQIFEPGRGRDPWSVTAKIGVRNAARQEDAFFQIRATADTPGLGLEGMRFEWLDLNGQALPVDRAGRPHFLPEGAAGDVAVDDFEINDAVVVFEQVPPQQAATQNTSAPVAFSAGARLDLERRDAQTWVKGSAQTALGTAYQFVAPSAGTGLGLGDIIEPALVFNRKATDATDNTGLGSYLPGMFKRNQEKRLPMLANVAARHRASGEVFHFFVHIQPIRMAGALSWQTDYLDMDFSPLRKSRLGKALVRSERQNRELPLSSLAFDRIVAKYSVAHFSKEPK
jgi:hypothetical protein